MNSVLFSFPQCPSAKTSALLCGYARSEGILPQRERPRWNAEIAEENSEIPNSGTIAAGRNLFSEIHKAASRKISTGQRPYNSTVGRRSPQCAFSYQNSTLLIIRSVPRKSSGRVE